MSAMPRRIVLLLPFLLLLTACTASKTPTPDPSATSAVHSIKVGDRTRTYRLHGSSATAAVPLVVVLHGAVGTGLQAEQSYGWDAVADRDRFVVAYPDGVNRTWNASPDCCGLAAK